jgi:hypothetical protein
MPLYKLYVLSVEKCVHPVPHFKQKAVRRPINNLRRIRLMLSINEPSPAQSTPILFRDSNEPDRNADIRLSTCCQAMPSSGRRDMRICS